MILCHCAAVSEATVRRTIREGAWTVAEVSRRCGAARRCTPCRETVAEMILVTTRSEERRPPEAVPPQPVCAA